MPKNPLRTIYLGFDLATTSGIAILDGNDYRSGVVADPLRFWDSPIGQDILSLKDCRVVAVIERPPAGMHGSAIPRWLGGRIEEEIKRTYPRRNQIVKVTPTSWQSKMIGKSEDTKRSSLRAANSLVPYRVEDHNESDAILLATYGRWNA